jgi:hypothetical protein
MIQGLVNHHITGHLVFGLVYTVMCSLIDNLASCDILLLPALFTLKHGCC